MVREGTVSGLKSKLADVDMKWAVFLFINKQHKIKQEY